MPVARRSGKTAARLTRGELAARATYSLLLRRAAASEYGWNLPRVWAWFSDAGQAKKRQAAVLGRVAWQASRGMAYGIVRIGNGGAALRQSWRGKRLARISGVDGGGRRASGAQKASRRVARLAATKQNIATLRCRAADGAATGRSIGGRK